MSGHASVRTLDRWSRSPSVLHGLAIASVLANVGLVLTGGAVRLTASGLGCPTWPSCADGSLVPTSQASYHGWIENGNRQLTFVLGVVAVLTLIVAIRQRREIRYAALALAIIPVQAVIGGISVLTELNPWVVALHFLTSMVAIALTMVLWWRVGDHVGTSTVNRIVVNYARFAVVVTAVVLALGTVVTGSGPHAGDSDSNGRIHRTGLKVASVSQLHADAVMVLIGVTVGLLVLVHALRCTPIVRRAAWWLLAAELSQGVIGYVQYFTHVPAALVEVHLFGACLVWVAAWRVLLVLSPARTGAAVDLVRNRSASPQSSRLTA
jgi:cytochrome c oxidase assembly protein subunit 15